MRHIGMKSCDEETGMHMRAHSLEMSGNANKTGCPSHPESGTFGIETLLKYVSRGVRFWLKITTLCPTGVPSRFQIRTCCPLRTIILAVNS